MKRQSLILGSNSDPEPLPAGPGTTIDSKWAFELGVSNDSTVILGQQHDENDEYVN